MTHLTAPTRKPRTDRYKAFRQGGTVVTVERQIEHLADQLWDTVRIVRRLARLDARRARQTTWLDAHGHECPEADYQRRVAILEATEERWATERVAFLEAAERACITFRMIQGQPHQQIRETYSVDYRDAGKTEQALRGQWAWWIRHFMQGVTP